ncbi:hypothetical protein U9M48_000440 [Paspalum notatum var. saurae]|uniref:Reverse transcriptase domain-containing protein n=1 Tax=Paspalum notatum var. saurae TaxID=547442 RepID=A0AAQ3PI43_PASNO
MPPKREVEFHIDLIHGTQFVSIAPYHLSRSFQEELRKQLHEQLSRALVLFPKKKDGSWCMCLDYRGLIAATINNKVFSKFDLQSVYNQIPMSDEDIVETIFATMSLKLCHLAYPMLLLMSWRQ